MNIEELLRDDEAAIVDDASRAVARLEHYGREGNEAVRQRVAALHRRILVALHRRDLEGLYAYVARIARERHAAGYGFTEMQAAFTALEQTIWRRAEERLDATERAWGLGIVGTLFAHVRDALARAYAGLTPRGHGAWLDLTPLFEQPEPAALPADELVYPV
jgi:hypothetical protein